MGYRPRSAVPVEAAPIVSDNLGVTEPLPRRPLAAGETVALTSPGNYRPQSAVPAPPDPGTSPEGQAATKAAIAAIPVDPSQRLGAGPTMGPPAGPIQTVGEVPGSDTGSAVTAFLRSLIPGYDYASAGAKMLQDRAKRAVGIDPRLRAMDANVPLPADVALERARSEGEAAERDSPIASGVGGMLPMLAAPEVKAAQGAGLGARALAAVKRGVVPTVFEFLQGLGRSKAPDASGKLEDAAVRGGSAAALMAAGELGLAGAKKIAPAGDAIGENIGRRFLTGNSSPLASDKAAMPGQAVRAGFDRLPWWSNVQEAAPRIQAAKNEQGNVIDRIVTGLKGAGVEGPAPRKLGQTFLDEGAAAKAVTAADDPLPGAMAREGEGLWPFDQERAIVAQVQAAGINPSSPAGQAMVQAAIQRAGLRTPKQSLPSGNLSLEAALGMERSARDLAKGEYAKLFEKVSPLGQAKKDVASIYNRATDDAIQSQAAKAPDLVADWIPANRRFGDLADASGIANEAASRAAKRNMFGLRDFGIAGGTFGMTHSPVKTALALAGSHVARTRLPNTIASAGFTVADLARMIEGARVPAGLFTPRSQSFLPGEALSQRVMGPLTDESVRRLAALAIAKMRGEDEDAAQ